MHGSSISAWRSAAAVLLCVLMSSCGGGSGAGTTNSSQSNKQAVGLSFLIPSAATVASAKRKPAYISSLTASIAVTVYPSTAPAPATPTTVANVGPGLPGCTTSSSGTTCIVTVNAPLGNDTFLVSAYSAQNGGGTVLSQATITQGVTVGMGPIAVTLAAVGAIVTGDMLGYVASRTWTYTVSAGTNDIGYETSGYSAFTGYGFQPFVVGIYADPTISNGIASFVAFAAPAGTSNPFSPSNQIGGAGNYPSDYGIVGAMGVQSTTNGYLVASYGSISNNSFGTIPGTTMLVPSSLQLGQTWNPLSNAASVLGGSAVATVTDVGAVPGIAYCPNSPSQGATVQYTLAPQGGPVSVSSVSYVPGCGITDYVASSGGEFTLSAVGTMNLGTLDITRPGGTHIVRNAAGPELINLAFRADWIVEV